jgi:hypothetical protein
MSDMLKVLVDRFKSSVGRAAIYDDELQGRVFLVHHALECLADVFVPIQHNYAHGQLRRSQVTAHTNSHCDVVYDGGPVSMGDRAAI